MLLVLLVLFCGDSLGSLRRCLELLACGRLLCLILRRSRTLVSLFLERCHAENDIEASVALDGTTDNFLDAVGSLDGVKVCLNILCLERLAVFRLCNMAQDILCKGLVLRAINQHLVDRLRGFFCRHVGRLHGIVRLDFLR